MKSVNTMPRSKGFKERSPRAWVAHHGDRVAIRRVVPATSWRFRDALARADERNAMGGRWVAAIDEVYPESWLRAQADAVHPVAIAMAWPHALATRTIADVADLVVALKAGGPAHAPVLERLQRYEDFLGTVAEARVARILRDAGASFEILPAKGGATAPDFRVEGDSPFFCEVKHVNDAQLSSISDSLTSAVFPFVALSVPRARWAFDWNGPEVAQLTRDENTDRLRELAERAMIAVSAGLARGPLDRETRVEIDGVGSITIWPEAMPEGEVGADTLKNDERNAGRAAQRVAQAARRQLTKELPGVVVVCWEAGSLDRDAVTAWVAKTLDDLAADGEHVAGVVLLVVTSGLEGVIEETWPIENPHSRVRLGNLLPAARAPTRTVRFSDFGDLFAVS